MGLQAHEKGCPSSGPSGPGSLPLTLCIVELESLFLVRARLYSCRKWLPFKTGLYKLLKKATPCRFQPAKRAADGSPTA